MKLVNLSILDVDCILQLVGEFNDGYSFNQLKSAFNNGRFFCLGIKDKESLVAFVCYSVAIEQADIETVFVKTDYRRQGLAKKLIINAHLRMLEAGAKKAFLEVRKGNVPARALYQSIGYTEISVRKKYYSDDEDAVVMAKELA